MFHDGIMRKSNKSVLGSLKSFAPIQDTIPNNCQFIIDGGHLLHSVPWSQSSNYSGVCKGYIYYVFKHYGSSSIFVFDSYSTVFTKATEQLRWTKKSTSSDIFFEPVLVDCQIFIL